MQTWHPLEYMSVHPTLLYQNIWYFPSDKKVDFESKLNILVNNFSVMSGCVLAEPVLFCTSEDKEFGQGNNTMPPVTVPQVRHDVLPLEEDTESWVNFKISKILNFRNSNFETGRIPTNMNNFMFKWLIVLFIRKVIIISLIKHFEAGSWIWG